MAAHILIASAIASAWALSLYVKPFGRCWRCGGKGNLHRTGPQARARLPAVQGHEAAAADRLPDRPPRGPHGRGRAGPDPEGTAMRHLTQCQVQPAPQQPWLLA